MIDAPSWELESRASAKRQRYWRTGLLPLLLGKAEIKWQAKAANSVENDPDAEVGGARLCRRSCD
jgi:hypothetical protein